MKIELSPSEVTYLVECCMRSDVPALGVNQHELLLRLKFSFLDVEPFRRMSQKPRLKAQGCDDGVGVDLRDMEKVRRLATHRNAK